MSEMKKIIIINGVNLGALGTREIDIYGCTDFKTYFEKLQENFPQCELENYQSDQLSDIVEKLHQCRHYDGIILNPGAFTHTSLILADAVKAIPARVVEVHISNLFGREQYRKESVIASVCAGSISGFGLKGYDLAIFSFLD